MGIQLNPVTNPAKLVPSKGAVWRGSRSGHFTRSMGTLRCHGSHHNWVWGYGGVIALSLKKATEMDSETPVTLLYGGMGVSCRQPIWCMGGVGALLALILGTNFAGLVNGLGWTSYNAA
jgi:hypothetical protein